MKILNKVWRWHIAHSTYRLVWRVTYENGQRTCLLSKAEAEGLRDVFKGKMWIDYEKGYF